MDTSLDKTTHPFPLASAAEGDEVFVTSFRSGKEVSSRLKDLGLISGARVKVVHRRGGDVVVARDNLRLALGEAAVKDVMVIPCGAEPAWRRT